MKKLVTLKLYNLIGVVSAQLFRKLIQLSFGDRYRAPNYNGNLTLPQMSLQFTQCRIEQSVILAITKSDKIINLIALIKGAKRNS